MRIIDRILQVTVKREAGKEMFFVNVCPREVAYIKIVTPGNLPVVGEGAIYGAVAGLWDMFIRPFRYHYIYRSLKCRIVKDKDWSRTPLNRKRRRERGAVAIHNENIHIDRLISDLGENGYLSQHDRGINSSHENWRYIGDRLVPKEMLIGMDRYGRLFQLADGRHRLAISQLLDIKTIPAILSIYHPNGRDKLPEESRIITGSPDDYRPF